MTDTPYAMIGCEIPCERLFDEGGTPREFLKPNEDGWTQFWSIGPLLVLPLLMGGKERFIAGVQVTPGGDENFRRLSAFQLAKSLEWCLPALTHWGLWDEDRFGLWAGTLRA